MLAAESYRDYLTTDIKAHQHERGYQKRLADAANCNPSYLSQVIHAHMHLTPDQAVSLCQFWSFNEDRTDYFLGLVQLERASSAYYKTFLQQKLKKLREKHTKIATRVAPERLVSNNIELMTYYTNWQMSAVHVLTSIEAFQTPEALAGRLRMPKDQILSIIDQLVSMGFVQSIGDRYKSIVRDIHVEQSSPLNVSNHFQWRHRSMAKILDNNNKGLNYTAVHALSVKDIQIVRELLMEFIQRSRAVVTPSPEEEAIGICCDLFYV